MNNSREVFAENLRIQLKEKKKTQNDLSEYIGVSKTTVSEWISGKKYPRIDKIQSIADFFDIYRSDLTEVNENIRSTKGFKIPVLGRVVAGIPVEAIEEILDYEEIDSTLARTGEFFALQIKGDSMEPRMIEGDVVIVRKQKEVNSGDIAIVLVNGDEATVKRVRILENGLMLIPFNSKYVPWTYTAEEVENMPVQIIGKVVELRGKF